MHTDTSGKDIGTILQQDGKLIRLYSKKLNDTEGQFIIIEKELYTILKGSQEFNTTIGGNKLTIYTDNKKT